MERPRRTWCRARQRADGIYPGRRRVAVSFADTSVALSWRPYPGTNAVHVVRQEARDPHGPDDGTVVEASLTGAADTD